MNASISLPFPISRFGASHGCVTKTKPGLAPKRLICIRSLGKTNPLNDDDLTEFVKLQKKSADSDKSWTVDAKDIDPTTFDLSVKNPNGGEEVVHRTPKQIMKEIAALDAQSARVLTKIRGLL